MARPDLIFIEGARVIDPAAGVDGVRTVVVRDGAIAEVVGAVLGRGGPRQVGSILAAHGGPVPWWRVVRADGSLPPSHHDEARQRYLEEGTPLRPSGNVDIRTAFWRP